MADRLETADQLVEMASGLEYGPTKTEILAAAVRIVDAEGNIEAAYEIRQDLIAASSFGGQPDLTLVHFSWCLAQFDRSPEKFDVYELLWKYKWVIGKLSSFPQINREQIETMLNDMEARYRAYGSTLHAVYHKRRTVAVDMGDVDAAVEAHRKLAKTQRDNLSDCPACVADSQVDYLRFRNQALRSINEGIALIHSELKCGEVPDVTYSLLLVPLLKFQRAEEAMAYHRKGYRLNARNPGRLGAVIRHLEFLVLTDNYAEALKLLQKHLTMALTGADFNDRFEIFRVARLLFERLHESGKTSIKVKLPADFSLANAEGKYATDALAQGFSDEASAIALRFDARNGNDSYQKKLANLEKLKKLAIPFPMSRSTEE